MKSVFRFSLALSACLLLIAPVVFGQTTGEIMGTVMGTDGRPLPGVTVECTSASLQGTRVSVTGNDGVFRFISLPPGSYKIKGNLSGFTTVEKVATVKLDSTVTVQMQLQVSAKEELVVTGEAPVVDSTTAESGTNIRQEVAQKLPVGRNYSSVVAIQPGVATDQSETQGRGGSTNPTGGGWTIYGATSVENSYLVDGVNTTNVIKGFQGKALSQEFIEEVQVKSSGYEAEYGRSTGGVINVVTKSGGNDFHGDAFGYFTTKGLTADYKGFSDIVYNDAQRTSRTSAPTRAPLSTAASRTVRTTARTWAAIFVKDHIWFFGAYNRVTYNNSQFLSAGTAPIYGPLVAGVDQPFDSTANIYSGKLTFRLGQGTTLVGTVFGDPEPRDGQPRQPHLDQSPHQATPPGTSARSTTPERSPSCSAAPRWSRSRYAKHQDRYRADARRRNRRSADPRLHVGRPDRLQRLRLDLRTHELQPLHARRLSGWSAPSTPATTRSRSAATTRTRRRSRPRSTRAARACRSRPARTGRHGVPGQLLCFTGHPPSTTGTTSTPTARRTRRARFLPGGNVANPKSIRYSAFLQDKWTVIPSLTVSLGVRWDQEDVKDYTDQTIFLLKNEWQPRIGIAWDVVGDGSSKLAASAGRFYFAMPTDLNVRAYGAQTTATVGTTTRSISTSHLPGSDGAPRAPTSRADRSPSRCRDTRLAACWAADPTVSPLRIQPQGHLPG